MAERKPVVLVGGVLKEMPSGGALPAANIPEVTAANIHAATSKATPVDADELGLSDSAASWGLKKLTFANLAAWVRNIALAGLSTATNAVITASDTVIGALGKLQKQVSDNLTTLTNHTGNTSNPHGVTKAQVGLGSVDNTSDASKPISSATASALAGKAGTSDSRLTDPREWTAATVDQAEAEAGTATARAAWTAQRVRQAVVAWWATVSSTLVTLSGAQTVAGVKTFSSRSVHAGAYTPSATPAHSATPTFDCATGNVFEPAAMTGNVTSITLSNAVAGQTVQIRFQQDATGGRTCAVPSGAKVDGSINTGANRVSWLVLTYSSRASRWEGNFFQVPA